MASSSSSLSLQAQSDPSAVDFRAAAATAPVPDHPCVQSSFSESPRYPPAGAATAAGATPPPPPATHGGQSLHALAERHHAEVDSRPPDPLPPPLREAQAQPPNDAEAAATAAAARARAFKLVYAVGTGIPHTLFLIVGLVLLTTQGLSVPEDQCEPSIRINLMVDMGISFLLALSTFYVCSVRRVERRSLRIGVLLAWNSKIFFNFLQVSAVFDPDNKCKLGDRVVWTAVTFRLCLFFGTIAGCANSRLGELIKPRAYRARDSVFLELWGVFNLVLAIVVTASLLLYDAPTIPSTTSTTSSGTASNTTISAATFSSAASTTPAPHRYCEQSVPSYLYFELIASVTVLVSFIFNGWVRFVKRLDAWEFRTRRFASLELRTGFLVSIALKVAALVVGARAVIPSRPVCAEYDPQLFLFARAVVGTRAVALISFIICYSLFKGAVVEHPLTVEANAADARKRAAIDRCTVQFDYSPEAVAERLRSAVSAAAAARRAGRASTGQDSVAAGTGEEPAAPTLFVTTSAPVDRRAQTPRGESPIAPPSLAEHTADSLPKHLDVLDALGIPSTSSSSSSTISPLHPASSHLLDILDLTLPRAPSHRSLSRSRHSSSTSRQHNTDKGEADACPVCCEPYEACSPMLAMVRCGHAFHRDCLHAWLMRAETEGEMRCPLCRTGAFDEDDGYGGVEA